jgi:hypothetical protein
VAGQAPGRGPAAAQAVGGGIKFLFREINGDSALVAGGAVVAPGIETLLRDLDPASKAVGAGDRETFRHRDPENLDALDLHRGIGMIKRLPGAEIAAFMKQNQPKLIFTRARVIFTRQWINFNHAQMIFTRQRVIFTRERVIFTGERVIFTGERLIFTHQQVIFTQIHDFYP